MDTNRYTNTDRSDIAICLHIITAWRRIKTVIDDFAANQDLTMQQIMVLYQLYDSDQILMGTLAKQLHCDASNVTGLVDRLRSAGLITRHELAEDRRAKQLAITDKGRALIEELIPLLPSGLDLSSLSAARQLELLESLQRLTDQ
ncbi:MAG TPA: MarR family transcriptional regulator [Candidatus Saccharimonadales bacterium]